MAAVTIEQCERRFAEEIEQYDGPMIFEALQQLAVDLGFRLVAKEYPDAEPEKRYIIWFGFGGFYAAGGDGQLASGSTLEEATESAIAYLKSEFLHHKSDESVQ